jgi:NADH-quinone oxidoreductase subunit J
VNAVEIIVFAAAALLALVGAAGMVSARNPVHSALFLIANFIAIAVIYLLLLAPVLAVLQVLIYAGAIMVLFIFVIFFFVQPAQKHETAYSLPAQAMLAGLAVFALICILIGGLFFGGAFSMAQDANALQAAAASGPQQLGISLFTTFLLPFELVSILLLAAILGATAMARRVRKEGGD